MEKVLLEFFKRIGSLNRATVNGLKAPHKPILLLSVIESIAFGEILENKIEISPLLVARFKDNWNRLVNTNIFQPNFALPFFHMQKEGFWKLKTYFGKEILVTSSHSIKSFSQLKESVAYSYLDSNLFALIQNPKTRDEIYRFITVKYFGKLVTIHKQYGLVDEVTEQILNEPSIEYQKQIQIADDEEIFVRCGVFKRVVPKIYDYTCCVSGMRIISGYDIQMVDACHIVPFSVSHNDTISNGISLSPNLHRAFDRGLITLNENYRVVISKSFTEYPSENMLKLLEGKQILLPKDNKHYPSTENLKWHNDNVFKN
ncbi:MAG: HNH endonuclease [Bacteroidetes bacterium]|nr:HNH endonuclease [Bacteroidota bacterium]